MRSLALLLLMAFSLIIFSTSADAHSRKKMQAELDAAVGVVQKMLDRCQTNLDTARNSNTLLIETNARLTAQLDAGKLDSLAVGEDIKGRLSECEFRTRELEDTIVDKENQITDMEAEVEKYSEDVRMAIEDKQKLIDKGRDEKALEELDQLEMNLLADEFSVEFFNEIDNGLVSYKMEDDGISLTLKNSLLFKPGGVDVTKKGRTYLKRVLGAIRSLDDLKDWEFVIAGHTDDVAPGRKLRKWFPTNWEMSQARAANVVHHIIEKEGFPPEILGAMGYGEHRPVATNETRKGRAENLRLVFHIVRLTTEEPEEPEESEEPEPVKDDSEDRVTMESIEAEISGNKDKSAKADKEDSSMDSEESDDNSMKEEAAEEEIKEETIKVEDK
jgi:chemotaxis protein MotB